MLGQIQLAQDRPTSRKAKCMLVFLDTEFTDFIDFELISIGLVSEDGKHVLYLEVQDFDRSKCSAFVQSAVWSHLGHNNDTAVCKADLPSRLWDWFATLPHAILCRPDTGVTNDRPARFNAAKTPRSS